MPRFWNFAAAKGLKPFQMDFCKQVVVVEGQKGPADANVKHL
jgi:hypothetical protein